MGDDLVGQAERLVERLAWEYRRLLRHDCGPGAARYGRAILRAHERVSRRAGRRNLARWYRLAHK